METFSASEAEELAGADGGLVAEVTDIEFHEISFRLNS